MFGERSPVSSENVSVYKKEVMWVNQRYRLCREEKEG